ncbi:MAG: hypothetical protein JST26_04460 [Bacteroidetes bacterium]|nr:hypothetical protein [Bacteroidota bacterium]
MKKAIIIFVLPILLSFIVNNEPPSKYYYKDSSQVNIWSFDVDDTAIYLHEFNKDLFEFKGDTKKYQIFYDKKFTILAVDMDLFKKDRKQYYKRYSRNGQLLMSWTKLNDKYNGVLQRFYSDGKIRYKEHFDNNGKSLGDTTWSESGLQVRSSINYNSKYSKLTYYYANGKVSSELYEGSSEALTRFIIDYDSISGAPSYFLCRDTSIISIEEGNEINTVYYRKTPLDSVIVIKKNN